MRRKKVKLVLLAASIAAFTGILVNTANVKALVSDSVKQDVVYTQEDSQDDEKSDCSNLSKKEDSIIKEKSKESIKKYFDLSEDDFGEGYYYYSVLINNDTVDDVSDDSQRQLDEEYNEGKGDLSKEDYEKTKNQIAEDRVGFRQTLDKLKHGYIQATWYSEDLNRMYTVIFNENTKEVESISLSGSDFIELEETNPSNGERKDMAEEFIKKYNLAEIQNPKLVAAQGSYFYYEDENDSEKTVLIPVDRKTGAITRFDINNFAKLIYDRRGAK